MDMAERLRKAIRDSGKSVYAIAQDTGIAQPVLSRFLSGERTLTLTTADKLCEYLGLELVESPKRKAKK